MKRISIAFLLLACADASDVGSLVDGGGSRDAQVGAVYDALPPVVDMAEQRDAAELKGPLEPCEDGDECRSGYCLQFEDQNVCSQLCRGGDCPDGWSCKSVVNAGADVVFICVPDRDVLCEACQNNTDCGQLGDMCVTSPDGPVCGRDCSVTGNCPEGYVCADAVDPAGNEGQQCVPESGRCSCRPDQLGETRPCARQNAFGACNGVQTCGDMGWTECSAQEPAEEDCDGLDNDCDGQLDEGLMERPCEGTPNQFGACPGVGRCMGAMGWVCDAPTASAEVCDGADNDCNGAIDDGLCFDGDPCTNDICVPGGGCEYPPSAGACDDGNACTRQDHCVNGECVGEAVECDDGNACTGDRCDPIAGCQHPNLDGAPCDLGNACTQDTCQAGQCVVGPPVQCPQNNPCLLMRCDPVQGCVGEPQTGNRCDDGDDCTLDDECSNGQCIGGGPYCAGRPCVNNCQGQANLQLDGICVENVPILGTTCFCVCL